ncbi:MAG: hypothetical protein Q9222_004787 [Ikaeria aurantiellina]
MDGGSIIVYDPSRFTITLQKRNDLNMRTPIKILRAPRLSSHLDVYLKYVDSEVERLAARLDLCVLGSTVNLMRALGKINEVWVMELDWEFSPKQSPKIDHYHMIG